MDTWKLDVLQVIMRRNLTCVAGLYLCSGAIAASRQLPPESVRSHTQLGGICRITGCAAVVEEQIRSEECDILPRLCLGQV